MAGAENQHESGTSADRRVTVELLSSFLLSCGGQGSRVMMQTARARHVGYEIPLF